MDVDFGEVREEEHGQVDVGGVVVMCSQWRGLHCEVVLSSRIDGGSGGKGCQRGTVVVHGENGVVKEADETAKDKAMGGEELSTVW